MKIKRQIMSHKFGNGFRVWAVVIMLLTIPVAFAQNEAYVQIFFENMSDIPLMRDMEEMADSAVIFDTPAGRVIESVAVGQGLDKDAIELFYNRTLPQLGWVTDDHGVFIRQSEKLYLEVEEEKEYSILFLRVEPSR